MTVKSNDINNLLSKKIKYRDLENNEEALSNLNLTQTWFESICLNNLRSEYRTVFNSVPMAFV